MYKYLLIVLLAFALSATAKPTNPLFPVTAKDMGTIKRGTEQVTAEFDIKNTTDKAITISIKMNEKLNLVAKAALDEYVIETLPSEPEPSGPEGLWKVSCEGQFNFEKLLCDFVFITEVTAATSAAAAATSATAAASTPAVTPALLTSYASFAAQWYLCQNSANNNYKACVKERQGK